MGLSAPGADQARAALAHFPIGGAPIALEPHSSGLIHHAWLVSVRSGRGVERYLLQRLNQHVFPNPSQVLENMRRITEHLAARLARDGARDAARRVVTLVATRTGALSHRDERGEAWRLLRWIEGTRAVQRAQSRAEAHETARAFGLFARQLADLGPPALHFTIPGFHDTEARLLALERVIAEDRAARAAACREETAALLDRRPLATAVSGPAAAGGIAPRPVHNDAKIANVLFDAATGEALAVVDLDTTMPGLCAHDFGDLVRSTVSDSAEDERDLGRVVARVDVFEALAAGFLEGIGDAITPAERALLVTGARVIVFEQAARFLADHLDGDRYYRTTRAGHNLDRARAQLRLLASLESLDAELERLVAGAAARQAAAGRRG